MPESTGFVWGTPSDAPLPASFDEPPSHGPDDVPFHVGRLFELCCQDAAAAGRALDSFERQGLAELNRLAHLGDATDVRESARIAHAWKGSAGLLQAESLCRIATELEAASAKADRARVAENLGHLRAEMQRCVRYVPSARQALTHLGSRST